MWDVEESDIVANVHAFVSCKARCGMNNNTINIFLKNGLPCHSVTKKTMQGKVVYINLSGGGVPKLPVPSATLFRDGFFGDVQKNKKHHGGPERAVCLFSMELIEQLQAEGHPIAPGTTGENLTVQFPNYHLLVPDTILQIGNTVRIQITRPAPPCKTIKRSFINENFNRIAQKLHPGQSRLYARVLQEGTIQQGDEIKIITIK